MSRPIKNGLDYFPMDVTTDEKFEIMEAKYGLIGFAVIVKLYQRIYKEGYYVKWDEEKLLIFRKSISIERELLDSIISDCFKYNIFDKNKFNEFGILTSSGIQGRFFAACERRKKVDAIKEFINVDINSINVDINWINVDINSINVDIKYTKERKEKERKEKESNCKTQIFDSNNIHTHEKAGALTEDSLSNHGALTEDSLREGDREEEKEKEVEEETPKTPILNLNTIPSYEEAVERILSPSWIDSVTMNQQFQKNHFVDYARKWIDLKHTCGGLTYRTSALMQYLVQDYKKELAAGTIEKPYVMAR